MKKSLIALAVLAASGVASAQSTVTIYGLVDAYVGVQKINGLSQTGINLANPAGGSGGALQTSRFGLKGSEDLGGGLKANFVLEAGFDPSTGVANQYTSPYGGGVATNAIFGRQSWVGLSGGFGEVKLGKMWTPYDEVKGSGAAAFDANIFAPAANVWASNNYSDRPGNSIYYSTPNIAGFSGAIMYGFGENKTTTASAGKVTSVNVQYGTGPFAIALSHQREKTNVLNTATTKYTQLNSSWDFGVVVLKGAYGQVKDGTNGRGLAVAKSKEYQIGLDFPVTSAVTISGGYARSKDTQTAGPEIKHRGYGIAALYALSKRTNLYVGAQSGKQNAAAAGPVGGAAAVPEDKVTVYAIGVRHTF